MGTRSRIAVQLDNGMFKSIYCHWDGYLSHNGKILNDHYQDPDKVNQLISLGDMSSLGAEIGEKHDFDTSPENLCSFYGRDRGELGISAKTSKTLSALNQLTQDTGGEFLYVFIDNVWYVAEGGMSFFGMPSSEKPGDLRLLSEALAAEEQE